MCFCVGSGGACSYCDSLRCCRGGGGAWIGGVVMLEMRVSWLEVAVVEVYVHTWVSE